MFAIRFLKKTKFDSYDDYIQNGAPVVPEHFNFAYDVIDVLANENPDGVALLWTDDSGIKKTFTFRDLSWSGVGCVGGILFYYLCVGGGNTGF